MTDIPEDPDDADDLDALERRLLAEGRVVDPAVCGSVDRANWSVDAPDDNGIVVIVVDHPEALAPVMLAFNHAHLSTLRATIEALRATERILMKEGPPYA